MISYVECLGGEGAGHGMATRCWNGSPDEERDELLPRKLAALHPKTEGSLRRRLLSARIHQHYDAIMAVNGGSVVRLESPVGDKKAPPSHFQNSGNSPWYRHQHFSPRAHVHPSLTPETHGKLFSALDVNGKPKQHSTPLQVPRSTCPVIPQRSQTPTPQSSPGYTVQEPSPIIGPATINEQEVPPQYFYQSGRVRRRKFFRFGLRWGRKSGFAVKQTTPLLRKAGDGDNKWSVHYSTQKPKHSIFFIPGKRQSGSAEDLQACNRLTQHGRSQPGISEPHPSSPPSSGPNQSGRRRWREKSRKMASPSLTRSLIHLCVNVQSSAFSDEEEAFFFNNTRPMTPLVLNPIQHTSHGDDFAPEYELRVGVDMERPPRLPTPEERMRQQAEAIATAVVPINVTGESFDRQASFRRVASNNDSLSQRYCNLSRRKTITGIPKSAQKTSPGSSAVFPGQFSTVGRPGSCPPMQQRQIPAKEEGNVRELGLLTTRRIRAPRGEGMSSLMASLTSPTPVNSGQVHSLPRLGTHSSLDSEASYNSVSYRALSVSSSCFQDMQGFPSDSQVLLPLNPSARGLTGSPFPSAPSQPFYSSSSSLPGSPGLPWKSQWSERDELLNIHHHSPSSHHLSSSSIADSEAQFSYQAQDDQAASLQDTQSSYTGGSLSETWSYRSLSPSSSVHSDHVRDEWNATAQDTQSISTEGSNVDFPLSSGCCPPSPTDSNSVCSEKIPTASSLNCEKRKQSASSTSSLSVTRSVSLRKSKRPPPPPLRSDSLRSCPNRTTPCHSSSSPCRKHSTQRAPASSPKTFHDPWVPRSNTRRRQSGFTCGTVSSFESLGGVTQVATAVLQSEHLPPNPGHSDVDVFTPGSPGSEEEGPRFTANHPQGETRLQRLASPSSGYSSQSNTPTPGTPVSSPITPSSPLTPSPGAFSPHSLFSPSQSPFFPPSPTFLPKQRSLGHSRPKPLVPERKSSHLSLSSSFSSTSSLSSCTSSDSSAKHPLLPPPPLPPPQTECVSSVFYSPLRESPTCPVFLPPPPPPPPLPSSMPPPPPPPLPPAHRPPPPPYSYAIKHSGHQAAVSPLSSSLNFTFTPAPPPSLLLHPSDHPTSSLDDLPLPPPPPPPLSCFPATGFLRPGKCTRGASKAIVHSSPLVTAEALQGVKLRSVKNQEVLFASIPQANQVHSDGGVFEKGPFGFNRGAESQKSSDAGCSEVSTTYGLTNNTETNNAVQTVLDYDSSTTVDSEKTPNSESIHANYQNLIDVVLSPEKQLHSRSNLINCKSPQELQHNDRKVNSDIYPTLPSDSNSASRVRISSSPGRIKSTMPLVSLQQPDTANISIYDKQTQQNIAEKYKDSSYLTLPDKPHRQANSTDITEMRYPKVAEGTLAADSDFKCNRVCKPDGPKKCSTVDKPMLPRKPDLCIVGLMATSFNTQGGCEWKSNGKTTAMSSEGSPPQLPDSTFYTALHPDLTHSGSKGKTEPSASPDSITALPTNTTAPDLAPRSSQKPPILHKKPQFSLLSLKTTQPACSRNTGEASRGMSAVSDTLETRRMGSTGNMETMGVYSPTILGILESSCIKEPPLSSSENFSTSESETTSYNCSTLGTHQTPSLQTGAYSLGRSRSGCGAIQRTTIRETDEKMIRRVMMRSSLAEAQDEDERVEKEGTKIIATTSLTRKKIKSRKRRKKAAGRQLLMMSSTMEPFTSSSSSSSSSSLSSSSSDDDRKPVKNRETSKKMPPLHTRVYREDTSDSESPCAVIGHSLSRVLSTDSLQVELSFPDLRIQEPGEDEDGNQEEEEDASGPLEDDVFGSVSADQLPAQGQPRTTQDLFAIIHRSKRKLLGRNYSDDKNHISSSPSSPSPLTAAALTRSSSSKSFKTLLLRKGSRYDLSSRLSAVERLRQPPDQPRLEPIPDVCAINDHMVVKVPVSPTSLCNQNFLWRQNYPTPPHLILTSSCSSPFFFFSSSHTTRPRPLTPPCSASRRFAARCRLYAAPMTAINEADREEEEAMADAEVFIGTSTSEEGRLVESF